MRELPKALSGKRIGLMGGTFQPIHNGHLALAETALRELALDAVLFMPAGRSYLKAEQADRDREDRYRMTALAIEGHPDYYLSRMEIDRPGNTYTADTLRELHALYPGNEWYFIVGADSLFLMSRWVRPEEIFARAVIACAVRDGKTADGQEVHADLGELEALREDFAVKYGARIKLLHLPRVDISSSEVRKRIASGESVEGMLPDAVIRYIGERGLYREDCPERNPGCGVKS